jgi:aminoglycoside phosphotransferase (APT) family kinase protein
MNDLPLIALCDRFRLGAPIAEPLPVTGCLMHRLWHITTTQGDFAVKQLNPGIMRQPGIRDRHRLTVRIAAAMAEHGVLAVTPLLHAGLSVQKIGSVYVQVFAWVEGTILPPGPSTPEQARLIGAALDKMHTLHLDIPGIELPTWRIFRDDDWVLLSRRGSQRQLPWAESLRDMVRDIRWWSLLAQQANKRLWAHLALSHCDLDQKNVLWQDASAFAIVDWDAAGLINPTIDLASTALAWSGQTVGEPSEATFRALIEGYRSAGGAPGDNASDALQSCLGNWLEWLEVNLQRSLKDEITPEEQALANGEVFKTLTTLQTLSDNIGLWAAWMEG